MRTSLMARLAAGLVLAVLSSGGAHAQSPAPPFDLDAQVTTSPSQIAPANAARRSIEFCNPNASVSVAICPAVSRRTGSAITCAFNGRGSITLPPSTCWRQTQPPGSSAPLSSAWNGIAASGTANITVIEIE